MKCSEKIKNIFYYLLRIKRMNKCSSDVRTYEALYTKKDILNNSYCNVSRDKEDNVTIKISKEAGKIYDKIYKQYLDGGNENEIILGQAILALRKNKNIIHPVITSKVKVDFIDKENVLSLKIPGNIKLEIEVCDCLNKALFKKIISRKNDWEKEKIDIMNYDNIKDKIQLLLNNDSEIVFKDIEDLNKIEITEEPVIYNCPILVIRKTDNSLWSKEFESIAEEIDNGYDIPKTIEALVEEKEIEDDYIHKDQWKECKEDILFPLDANEEQISIVKKICENEAILVQGPPGTGKSHTIANLICHFLAHGKRVLITSETSRALRVLINKIPKDIKPLCVNLLDDNNGEYELEQCIKNISDNLCKNPSEIIDDIYILNNERKECKKNQQVLYNKLKEIEFMENKKIHCKGNYYKLIHIGSWLNENEYKYGWIRDNIRYEDIKPVNEEQFNKLIELLKNNGKEYIGNINELIFICNKIPSYNEVENKLDRMIYLESNLNFYKDKIKGWYIPAECKCNYDILSDFLYDCIEKMKNITKDPMLGKMFELYYSSEIFRDSINNFTLNLNSAKEKLIKIRANINRYSIEIKEIKDMDMFIKDYERVYSKIKGKKKISKIFKAINSKYDYIFKNCYINGENIKSIEQLNIINDYIEERKIYNFLNRLWENIINSYIQEDSNYNIDNLISIERITNNLDTIMNWNREYRDKIIKLLGRIRIPININWYEINTYEYFIQCIECIKAINEYNDLKAFMEIIKKQVRNFESLNSIIKGIDKENIDYIKEAYSYIEKIMSMKSDMDEINYVYKKLEESCPRTLEFILENYKKNYKFNSWENAWKWAQYNNLFKKLEKIDEKTLQGQLIEEKNKEKEIINQIISKKAWKNIILNINEGEKRSLFSWVQAVKRIGKGRGKFVLQYSNIAKEEMEKCKSIIPVWIMPLEKVIENIRPSKEQFDVVIFDESSQSNIFAISALMRAKKAIIVGDDKQISPEIVGMDQGMISNFIDKYLDGIPHNQWFDLQTSLYDTALRTFKDRIMLKEHFRSVPEIVQFSNKLCYRDLIVPLRYPKIKEAFNSPIKCIKVEDGYREKTKQININEAKALVNKLLECCRDSKYNGMTMGVISLLGDTQSEFIENLLKNNLSKEEIERRKLVCGDAYSFQGDERDVIFLSMVVGDNMKYTALTKETDIKRFNVAVSRARNQIFLFYSIDYKNINNDCVRYKLIDYCNNYKNYKSKLPDINYVMQSKFQKDIYNNIRNLKCDIKSNIKLGKYIIDFILEGEHNRIAIICDDGNLYENNNVEKVLNLEMDLTRLGWAFYKIRGSKFYRNPEVEVEKLHKFLIESGLYKDDSKEILKNNLLVV
ncbi:DNA helicase [Clostridium botulinum A2B7 92]|uniref:AAA domain-containing protein n=1 Tax=Clostridium botulinum TaxID=1491 RepID=UPI0007E11F70|nr:AAA domain-containing protein [Clostridium botulinum]KEJ04085.1 DNA helicase [Clostridium botulinum A2B7 92]